jgi:hypothetical protein
MKRRVFIEQLFGLGYTLVLNHNVTAEELILKASS